MYDASLLLPAPPIADAGSDVTSDPDADAGPPLARWPARPARDDATGDLEIVLAVRSVLFGDTDDAGGVTAYDLDGVQTCPGPGSCKPFGNKDRCDDALGRDNSGGKLVAEIGSFTSEFSPARVNQRLGAGEYGALLRVRGYNGGRNDTKVAVALYGSLGTEPSADAGRDAGDAAAPAARAVPIWNGNDRWEVETGLVLGGVGLIGTDCTARPDECVPTYSDANAYVAEGVLVATLDIPLRFGTSAGSNLNLNLTNGFVVARLDKKGAGYVLDGSIGGRWATSRLLTSLGTVNDPFGPGKLCGSNPTYQNLKQLICPAADIMTDPARDNHGDACDAMSVAIGFTAESAKLGRVVQPPPTQEPCGAGYTDSCKSVEAPRARPTRSRDRPDRAHRLARRRPACDRGVARRLRRTHSCARGPGARLTPLLAAEIRALRLCRVGDAFAFATASCHAWYAPDARSPEASARRARSRKTRRPARRLRSRPLLPAARDAPRSPRPPRARARS